MAGPPATESRFAISGASGKSPMRRASLGPG
jgi:hypothetical protein